MKNLTDLEIKNYLKEKTVKDLANDYGVAYHVAYHEIRKRGIKSSNRTRQTTKTKIAKTHTKQDIGKDVLETLYLTEKKSIKAIAKQTGYSVGRIYKELLKHEIKMRSKGEHAKNNPEFAERMRNLANRGRVGIFRKSFNGQNPWTEKSFMYWAESKKIDVTHQFQFEKHLHRYDFHILGTNIIVEVDGAYFHNMPSQKEKDKLFEIEANKRGFRVVRFTDKEIKESMCQCFNKLLGMI